MSITTTNMGLTSWNAPSDVFDNTELADNWTAVDEHDHTSGKGVQIPTGGIANLAVTTGKLNSNAVTTGKISPGAVTTDKIATGTITAANLDALPAARVYNSANISIAANTATSLTYDSERFDTDAIHSTSTFTGRLTCQTAGVYLIWSNIQWAADTSGIRAQTIRANGSTSLGSVSQNATSAGTCIQICTAIWSMSVSDYVEVRVLHTSTTDPLNITAATDVSPEFAMVRIA